MPITADVYYQLHRPADLHSPNPVILIHGAGGNHLYWPPNIRRLPGYWVMAVDLPGHGKSPGPGKSSISAYSTVLLNWLQAMKIQKALLVGHSMGGAITLDMAIHSPERVLGIGLVGSSASFKVNQELIHNTQQADTYPEAISKIIQWSFSPQTSSYIKQIAAQRLIETPAEVLRNDLIASQEFDVTQQLDLVNAPSLVVCGEQDKMTPLRNSAYLAEHIPGAQMVVIPEAGHMVMIEKAAQVEENLIRFIQQVIGN